MTEWVAPMRARKVITAVPGYGRIDEDRGVDGWNPSDRTV